MTNAISPDGAWQDVRDLISARRTGELADRVLALTGPERAEVARRLPEFRAQARAIAVRAERVSWGGEEDDEEDRDWDALVSADDGISGLGEALRIVGAGTLPGPAAVAAWLTRREFGSRWAAAPDPAEVLRVLAARPAGFQADVAARLARKIRTAGDRTAPLALALLRACGGSPPEHDPLVLAWLSAGPVAKDPLTGSLLPRLFEAEGAGRVLREERLDPAPTRWLALLKRVLATGWFARGELLDGCLRRFLRGGDATDLRFFVRLHEMIGPSAQEAAARARDYLRLLPSSPGTVAALALAQVRRTGPHEDGEVREAIGALTFRPEAKLAVAGLRWLDEVVRRAPGQAPDLAPALVTAFGHTVYDVQRRASRLALKHAAAFAPAAEVLAEAVPLLPPALGAPMAAAFGGKVAAEEVPEAFTPAPLPALTEPEPFPASGLDVGWPFTWGWATSEQWLAAFVEQAAGDREHMRPALAAAFGESSATDDSKRWGSSGHWITAMAKEVLQPGTGPAGDARLPDPRGVPAPHVFLLRRLSEIYGALQAGTLPPVLLATPTVLTGHLDPDVLVDRLARCAVAGAEPLPADLCQALLRLPRGSHPRAAERAARLGSHAAASAASWLAGGGLPDPETDVHWAYTAGDTEHLFDEDTPPRPDGQVRLLPVLRVEPTGHALIDELLAGASTRPWSRFSFEISWWPAMLPSHREVVAVHFLPYLLLRSSHVHWTGLSALTDADGPPGQAYVLTVASFLGRGDSQALPPMLRMAVRGDLPAEAVGRQVALMIQRSWFDARAVLAALTRLAHQGAYEQVWGMLTSLLPGLLPRPGERPTAVHTRAVTLAADVATVAGARGEIPAVSAHAAGGRDSRFARECARLRDRLGTGAELRSTVRIA